MLFTVFIWMLLILAIAWKSGYFLIERNFPRKDFPLRYCLEAFSLFLILQLIIVPLLALFWLDIVKGIPIAEMEKSLNVKEKGWFNLFAIAISASGILTFLFLLPLKIRRQIWGDRAFIGLNEWFHDAALGTATWMITFPMIIILTQTLELFIDWINPSARHEQVAVQHLKLTFDDPTLFWVTVLTIVFVVPMVEEILFRGILLNWIRSQVGIAKGIVLSAFTFACFHFSISQGWDNVTLLPSLFLLGCFLGYLFVRQQSLWASISLHATFNAISIWMIVKS